MQTENRVAMSEAGEAGQPYAAPDGAWKSGRSGSINMALLTELTCRELLGKPRCRMPNTCSQICIFAQMVREGRLRLRRLTHLVSSFHFLTAALSFTDEFRNDL